MTWLTSLPVGVLVVGSLVLAGLVAVGSRLAINRFVPAEDEGQVRAIAGPLMPALAATFSVLTALTLASEAGYLRAAQDIVSTEAAQASRLAWASTTPGVESEPIPASLTDYLRDTRANEWHGATADERADPETTEAIADLERTVRAEAADPDLGTPTGTELLASLDGVTVARRDRIAASSREIPVLYVITLAISGAALVANAGALTFRHGRRAALLVAGLACVVAISMALLFSLAAPWDGPLVATGGPLDAMIRDLQSGYFSP